MTSIIVDAHVHPDLKTCSTPLLSAKDLHQRFESQVNHMLLIGLHELHCDNKSLAEIATDQDLKDYFTLAGSLKDFSTPTVRETFETYFDTGIFRVLKLHPRLQKFSLLEKPVVEALKTFSKYKLPVLIDCFHDGNQLLHGDPMKDIASIAEQIPSLKIIMAHSGGFEIFRALTFAKTFKNIYLDLSYSLLYFRESSLKQDFTYAIKSMWGERILFGTDFPDRPYDLSLKMTYEAIEGQLSQEYIDKFMGKNAASLLGIG